MNTEINITPVGSYITCQSPRKIPLLTPENIDTITTPGFLNNIASSPILDSDVISAWYGEGLNGEFSVSIDAFGVITMIPLSVEESFTDFQQFVGISNVAAIAGGTWTATRLGGSNYGLVHTIAEDESIIGIDITPEIRLAANEGFQLTSFDVIYAIAEDDLEGHAVSIAQAQYQDQTLFSPVDLGVNPILDLDEQATLVTPYVTNVVIPDPGFLNIPVSKFVAEVVVACSAIGEYVFFGLNLHFTKTL